MLYVSRAPWGIYELLEAFFQRHDIPVGPILFLREWGLSWRHPLPRRAVDHKRLLIEAMMALYADMPFVLIGDSGQHDPEVYRQHRRALRRPGPRRLHPRHRRARPRAGRRGRGDGRGAAAAGGASRARAPTACAIAEDAARLGLIAPDAVEEVRARVEERRRDGGVRDQSAPPGVDARQRLGRARRRSRSGRGRRAAIVPASTSASQLTTLRQNASPNSRIGSRLHPAGLHQRQHLEQLVERAEAAGEHRDAPGRASGNASCGWRNSGS